MKVIITSLLLIFLTFYGNAQEVESIRQWSFGLEIFPNSTSEIIETKGGGSSEEEKFYKNTERSKLSLSGLTYASYQITRRSFLSLGIGYQNTGHKTTKLPIDSAGTDPRTGYKANDPNTPSSPTDIEITYTHHSIQVPLFYKFNLTDKFFVRAGASYILTLKNTSNADLYFESGLKERENYRFDDSKYTKMNGSANFGIGYTYFRNDDATFYAQLNVERFLNKMSSNGVITRTPISTGLILGARF